VGSSTPPPDGELVLLYSTKPYVCVLRRRLAFLLAETVAAELSDWMCW